MADCLALPCQFPLCLCFPEMSVGGEHHVARTKAPVAFCDARPSRVGKGSDGENRHFRCPVHSEHPVENAEEDKRAQVYNESP